MLTHRGFSACIISEGKPIPEYLVAVAENPNTISCWIPSEVGKTFSVYWRDEGTRMHSCAFITLDGFVVPGRFLFGEGEAWRNGVRSGPQTERPFMFAQRPSSSTSGESMKDAGSIMLKIKLVTLDGSKAANPLQSIPDLNSQSHPGDHCVGYGQEKNTYMQSPMTWKVKPSDQHGNRSHVTFLFRYRSPGWLMAQGIISAELHVPRSLPAKRRVASAPVAQLINAPMTPSPSPPNSRKAERSERLNAELKNGFSPGQGPVRPALSARTVSVGGRGRHDKCAGEILLDFQVGPPLDPQCASGVGQHSSRLDGAER
ncbi:uncharacterized protein BJ212DRAFT_1310621 [Suillus subaureus]|uniref:DUF7918 domain-containing protein n=1 Tax=Suillus subaureus TaxID=48587 RepID=A0A9P7ENN4_9AGAM|nr:uncharacterized protein BJ212DRAFT_1310621 [Suillus subaureus]KAG1827167.1 hypothetical protein BJ212DRAFT_1310621 [Suillus subaureus]